ncbi:MAG: hypothetical protein WCP39_06260, partial [Chlamydiota bacterium]
MSSVPPISPQQKPSIQLPPSNPEVLVEKVDAVFKANVAKSLIGRGASYKQASVESEAIKATRRHFGVEVLWWNPLTWIYLLSRTFWEVELSKKNTQAAIKEALAVKKEALDFDASIRTLVIQKNKSKILYNYPTQMAWEGILNESKDGIIEELCKGLDPKSQEYEVRKARIEKKITEMKKEELFLVKEELKAADTAAVKAEVARIKVDILKVEFRKRCTAAFDECK